MKFLALMLMFSYPAFAMAPQGGNGGNICSFNPRAFDCGIPGQACYGKGYRVLEEFQFFHLATSEILTYGKSPFVKTTASPLNSRILQTDLTATTAGKRALKKFRMLERWDYIIGRKMIDAFYLLQQTYVSQKRFLLPRGAWTGMNTTCKKNTLESAILTDDTGFTVISEGAWKVLPLQSQEVLLIHETLRLLQTFSPWFKITDKELQLFTMSISGRAFGKLKRPFFWMMKEFHKNRPQNEALREAIAGLDQKIEESLADKDIRTAIVHAFLKGEIIGEEGSISAAVNELRNERVYRELVEARNREVFNDSM
jgi:hypothetical protein